jgi:uncharacterized membrane protein
MAPGALRALIAAPSPSFDPLPALPALPAATIRCCTMKAEKTLWDRVVHAVLFEGIALCLCAPVMSYVLGKSLFDTGVLTIALATCAMLWNMLYNAMFERVEKKFGFKRTVPVRIGHAVGFEGGLVLVVVLLAAWWLSISYWDAFLLEMGLIAFFLPYTYVYNLVYDKVRERLVRRGEAAPVSGA